MVDNSSIKLIKCSGSMRCMDESTIIQLHLQDVDASIAGIVSLFNTFLMLALHCCSILVTYSRYDQNTRSQLVGAPYLSSYRHWLKSQY